MKKSIKLLILVLVLPVLLSGCGAKKQINQDYEYIEEIGNQIVRCFDEKDAEGLKAMFSLSSHKNCNLDEQIENAFEKYEGKSVSFVTTNRSIMESSMREGKYTKKHFVPQIDDIVTDTSNEYVIGFALYQVYENWPEKEGIIVVVLRDSQENELAVIGGE